MLYSLVVAGLLSVALGQADTSIVLTGTNTAVVTPVASASFSQSDSRATYLSYNSTSSLGSANSVTYLTGSVSTAIRSVQSHTVTTNGTLLVTTSATATLLTASSRNSTAVASAARSTNTQPCNGYPELCSRSYGNVTHIGAHNSPFDLKGNVASNQDYGVTTQLNDGVRMLQFQVHRPNDTSPLLLCHTSCDLLYAGLLVDYLTTVREWLAQNPYDVITILMGNYGYFGAGNFSDPVYSSGINEYLYIPPTVPMQLSQWPTLAEMIFRNQRVVMILDYDTNMTSMPWLLDEFSFMWETPFSPTDRAFPCNVDRPPNQDRATSANRLYMANHNLNVAFEFAGLSIDIPASTSLNETNALSGYGSLGLTSQNCTATWNRPPNFLLVDFYNRGSFNGSTLQIAADANNVTYRNGSCCGNGQRALSAASSVKLNMSTFMAIVGVVVYSLL